MQAMEEIVLGFLSEQWEGSEIEDLESGIDE